MKGILSIVLSKKEIKSKEKMNEKLKFKNNFFRFILKGSVPGNHIGKNMDYRKLVVPIILPE